MRAALYVVPYAAVAAKTARLGTNRRHDPSFTAAQCSRAITRAARVFPGSTCLSQALAAECLLRRSGRAPRMTLGVAVDERRGFRAHAWLECDGVLVAGARDAAGYTPLAVREGR